MKKDNLVHMVFIVITIIVAVILFNATKVSDIELYERAINNSDSAFCAKISESFEVDSSLVDSKVNIQGMAVLRDVCYSDLAEPYDSDIVNCEKVTDSKVSVCEPNGQCFEMSSKEACYREVFKDYVSYTMPPESGEIYNLSTCDKLSFLRDNCRYLYAITTGDSSACENFENLCSLRKDLCIREASKVATSNSLGDSLVFNS